VPGRPDIAIVSLGTTMGWRSADEALAEQVRAAGASCRVVPVTMGAAGGLRRAMALTDAVEALAARRAASGVDAAATIFSSITAALLQSPCGPHAIRFDTIAALSRPGAGGAWQRRREPGVLRRAALLLPWSGPAAAAADAALGGAGREAGGDSAGLQRVGRPDPSAGPPPDGRRDCPSTADRTAPPQVILPPPVERAPAPASDAPAAIAYAANPDKRGLDVLCLAWGAARPDGARLIVGGIERGEAVRWLGRRGVTEPAGVEWPGAVERERWLALVAGARVFVNAARYEDWGLAQMEALAAGTPLVTVPTPGPNPALALAGELAPPLVAPVAGADALAIALGAGLALDEDARRAYAVAAERLLAPYRDEALRAVVAERVLPALLKRSS